LYFSYTDLFLNYWSIAGLRVPSILKLSRLDCLEKSLLIATTGQISEPDAKVLKTIWDAFIQPQFKFENLL
jgi:mRNA interferase MazF